MELILNFTLQVYSPQLHSPRRDDSGSSKYGTEIYSSSLKTESKKQNNSQSNNDYYYNKENELFSRKNDHDATLMEPRSEKYSSSYYSSSSKTINDNYASRPKTTTFNPISSPIHVSTALTTAFYRCDMYVADRWTYVFLYLIHQMQSPSPVARSPLTVTSTSRYESSSRNVTSPRNYSVSPTPRHDSASPINYVPASTHRIASPINIQRVSSPITTITQRVTSPIGETYKVSERSSSSSYKTSNYVTSDEIRGSPSYATAKRATSPGEHAINSIRDTQMSLQFNRT